MLKQNEYIPGDIPGLGSAGEGPHFPPRPATRGEADERSSAGEGLSAVRESGARLSRACAGTPPPGTEANGRDTRVHDLLGLRLAPSRWKPWEGFHAFRRRTQSGKAHLRPRDAHCVGGAPAHVPSDALPAARAPSLKLVVGICGPDRQRLRK